MSTVQRAHMQRYFVCVFSVLIALLLGLTLDNLLNLEVSPLFFAAVVVSSWYGGLAPGLFATVLAVLLNNYFFIPPIYSLLPNTWTDILQLIVFSLVALLISSLNSDLYFAKQQSEFKLAKLKMSYRRLLETAYEGIWIFDQDGKTEYVNSQLAQMLGYSVEQISDRAIFDFLEPDTQQEIRQWLAQNQHSADTKQQFEARLYRQDAAEIWVMISLSSILNEQGNFAGMVAMLTDITKRKLSETKRDREGQLLRAMLDILPVGVVISDAKGKFIEINPAIKAIWGENAPFLEEPSQYHEYKGWWADTGKPIAAHEWTLGRVLATGETIIGEEIDIESFDGKRKTILNSAIPICDETGTIINGVAVNVDITERKQAEEKLRQSEALAKARAEELETIMETVPAAVWIAQDPQCHQMTVNHSAYKLMRLQPGSVMTATPASGEYPFPFKIHKNGQDVNLCELPMQQAGLTGQETEGEFEFVFDEDDVQFIYGKAAPLRDHAGNIRGVIGAFLDITERKQAEEALRQSELMFRTLADTMAQMFWITQPDGYHEYFNRRWYDYTGKTLKQAQGEGWLDILHPDDVQNTVDCWQDCLQTGRKYEIEFRLRRAVDGEYRWHLGLAFPLRNAHGQIIKWFGSCTDIHEQKLLVEERAQALERERTARIELEKANKMKDDFLAVVSHELRSPLNPILGWAKLLKSRKLDTVKTTQALDTIERNAKLQARLIDDLLDVSRILRGKLSLNLATVDLITTIEAALETVHLAAETKSIQLQTEITIDDIKIEGDANRLQQVIWNLLTNAIKFTPEGGLVKLRLQKVGNFAQIQVIDTGKGISAEFLPHVFERFRQADDVTTRKFGGLGLGLAIVRHLVELHRGSVQAASLGENLGATFTVQLPLMVTASKQLTDYALSENAPNLQGVQIVVVDDDVDTLNLLTFILEQYGASVKAVNSAPEALNAIAQQQPNLLLSDIGMPLMDGYMLIEQVRKTICAHKLPAIALTAFAGEANSQKIISAGFQRHLTKPIEPAELASVIASLIYTRELEAETV
ncbi:PAS domain S-box protein [Nostoc sp. FACHB-110]|uniref:PAS domain S-box protein n=1 Tax=Nostoc sp. FACHB-110 TaxID=2692834 RepID=UPI0016872361|nr:PAS domain S-box protein [Nostoc sp. FACHB-110]MBD2437918.1 PAS domain S-box protein [Nostoc sp. FACHB-110]